MPPGRTRCRQGGPIFSSNLKTDPHQPFETLWLLRSPALLAVVSLAVNYTAFILTHIIFFQQTLASFTTMMTEYGMVEFTNFF
jgi:hypothetical protein